MPAPGRTPAPFTYCGRALSVHAGGLGVVSGRVVAQLLDGHGRIQAVRVARVGGRSVWAPRERIVTDITGWETR